MIGITHRFLGRLVEQRLALDAYLASDPGVLDEEIIEPWFVIGAPRTGTTVLYGLVAQDERHRVPEGWEFLRPVPPPALSDEAAIAARLALADIELRTPQVVSSGIASIHEYSGRMPKECLSAMSFAFRSEELVARYDIPRYEQWLHRCDMRPAYDIHRRVLQVLQRGAPANRWVLKTPVHLQNLPLLLSVYPDARLSATYRDPMSIIPSVSSLIAQMRAAHSDDVDPAAIGRYHLEVYARSLDGFVDQVDTGFLDPGAPDEQPPRRLSRRLDGRRSRPVRPQESFEHGGRIVCVTVHLSSVSLRKRWGCKTPRSGVAATRTERGRSDPGDR